MEEIREAVELGSTLPDSSAHAENSEKPTEETPAGASYKADAEGSENENREEDRGGQSSSEEKAVSEENAEGAGDDGLSEGFSLPIVFNHKRQELSFDEAVRYAQLGMKYEKSGVRLEQVKGIMHKLDFLSAQQDMTAEALVDKFLETAERCKRAQFEEKYGSDSETVEPLMRLWREKSREKYEMILADRKEAEQRALEALRDGLERRLADEYAVLKRELPNAPSFADLPDAVKREAAWGRELLGAYLLHLYKSEERASAARRTEEEARSRSAGRLSSALADRDSAEDDAFMRGVAGR